MTVQKGKMTKKKTKTKAAEDTNAETEQAPGQKYEKQLQQVVDDWAKKALKLLAEDVLALEASEGARETKPRTDDPALLRTLRTFGDDAVKGWVKLPPRPSPAELSLPPPSKESMERAAQRRRIEDGYTYTVDVRRFVNEDRARAGLPPLPPSEDEAPTSDR